MPTLGPATKTALRRSRIHGLLILAALLIVDAALFINLCDLVYSCGCKSLWNGAAEMCNVHASSPPHCPWCQHPWTGTLVFMSIAAAQAALILLPVSWTLRKRAVLALLALPLGAVILGILAGIAVGYSWPPLP